MRKKVVKRLKNENMFVHNGKVVKPSASKMRRVKKDYLKERNNS